MLCTRRSAAGAATPTASYSHFVAHAAAKTPATCQARPGAERVRTSEELQLLLGVALLPLPLRVEGHLAHAEEPRELVVVQVELLAGGVDPVRPPLVSELWLGLGLGLGLGLA